MIFGSGLTSGHPEAAPNKTGLFDFNSAVKVAPSTILNVNTGYALTVGRTLLQPQLSVENLLDRRYILKGAFTSGPSIGRPRNIVFRLGVTP